MGQCVGGLMRMVDCCTHPVVLALIGGGMFCHISPVVGAQRASTPKQGQNFSFPNDQLTADSFAVLGSCYSLREIPMKEAQ